MGSSESVMQCGDHAQWCKEGRAVAALSQGLKPHYHKADKRGPKGPLFHDTALKAIRP
jgi:hypothetical protein